MDINVLRGVLLVVLIIGFLGMWVWAWSKKRKPEFDPPFWSVLFLLALCVR